MPRFHWHSVGFSTAYYYPPIIPYSFLSCLVVLAVLPRCAPLHYPHPLSHAHAPQRSYKTGINGILCIEYEYDYEPLLI
jgi:hypothetical protein